MDIIGKINRSSRGNAYVLTIIDYATRYPEAIPLPSIETERVCDALIELFARVGIPDEIVTDQGSNFMSELMKQFCEKLGINKIKTSPYHPMANGLVENFNSTIKSMLKKYSAECPKAWDRFLPYLLFAYREVPQATTGFSPFELLYGRRIRGPLSVLREVWTSGEQPNDTGIIQYIMQMRERLASMTELAQDNKIQAQAKQKVWYDQSARDRSYVVGDRVLVLLPTSTQKLLAQWQGPYPITRRVGDVDYEVLIGRRRSVLHVNLLRKWHERETKGYLAARAERIEDFDYQVKSPPCLGDKVETWKDVHIADQFTGEQY